MFCSISGEVPQQPVVSRASGHLFERRLIEKHVQATGNCPMTGQPLNVETDLLPLQANKAVKPRVVGAASIPGMLAMFQNEWDELMLETFTLKQHLDTTRQELSQALYQHDAACRVIARLMRERDEARAMLSSLQAQGVEISATAITHESGERMKKNTDEGTGKMEVDGEEDGQETSGGMLGSGVLSELADTCAALSRGRKGRKPPPGQTSKEQLVSVCESSRSPALSLTPHSSAKPGVTCLAMTDTGGENYLALSGGVDKVAILSEVNAGKVVAKLTGHTKKVTAVALHSSSGSTTAFTAAADHSVKVWTSSDNSSYSEAVSFPGVHKTEIFSLSAHPSGNYLLGVSADNSWSFLDIAQGSSLLKINNVHDGENFSCGELHPDGLILACGASSGVVRLWDVREQKNVASLGDASGEAQGHEKGVSCLAFNQNGYLLASGGGEGTCKVWDLRKLKNVASMDTSSSKAVTSLCFDPAGVFLACGSSSGCVDFSVVKEWSCIATLSAHKKAVTGLSWGSEAAFLLSSSLDRTIKKQTFTE